MPEKETTPQSRPKELRPTNRIDLFAYKAINYSSTLATGMYLINDNMKGVIFNLGIGLVARLSIQRENRRQLSRYFEAGKQDGINNQKTQSTPQEPNHDTGEK